jgi:hypothetical protein
VALLNSVAQRIASNTWSGRGRGFNPGLGSPALRVTVQLAGGNSLRTGRTRCTTRPAWAEIALLLPVEECVPEPSASIAAGVSRSYACAVNPALRGS